MKELRRFTTLAEATQVREFLRASGISAHLSNEHAANMLSHMLPALGHVTLYVESEQLEEAESLLGDVERPPVREVQDESVEMLSNRAVLASVIGVTFLPFLATIFSFVLTAQAMGRKPEGRSTLNLVIATTVNLIGVGILVFLVYAFRTK